ncbi:hypothetical protein NPIL_343931 [Nephila pilipes]|uniref:Uncharacterized protein n=1 Tax=Nephila pilipes TaxID=299642 RepID=A0A8X6TEB6_NEPPI|nr:hypothetical protein NPIL_343931 [Nephila pilipes]
MVNKVASSVLETQFQISNFEQLSTPPGLQPSLAEGYNEFYDHFKSFYSTTKFRNISDSLDNRSWSNTFELEFLSNIAVEIQITTRKKTSLIYQNKTVSFL